MSAQNAIQEKPEPREGVSFGREAWRRVWASKISRACLAVLVVFMLVALWGEVASAWYSWMDVTPPWQTQNLAARYMPPGTSHWLGTDGLGRDVGLRLVQGARIAFQVGVVSSMIAIPLGVLLGCLGGYFGGRIDDLVVWISNTFASIPGLLFVLAIAMVVGKGLLGVFLAIGLTTWVGVCRLVRAEVLKQKGRGYVRAAHALGFSHSFLGIGAQGQPSWGAMISSARLRLWQGVWWELAAVTAAIFAVVLAFNLLGDALRDALDPRLHIAQD